MLIPVVLCLPVLVMVFATPGSFGNARAKVAIVGLHDDARLDPGDLAQLRASLRRMFIASSRFETVEPARVRAALLELKDRRCVDRGCLLRLGDALQVDKVAVATISALRKGCRMTVRVFDVGQGTVQVATRDRRCSLTSLRASLSILLGETITTPNEMLDQFLEQLQRGEHSAELDRIPL